MDHTLQCRTRSFTHRVDVTVEQHPRTPLGLPSPMRVYIVPYLTVKCRFLRRHSLQLHLPSSLSQPMLKKGRHQLLVARQRLHVDETGGELNQGVVVSATAYMMRPFRSDGCCSLPVFSCVRYMKHERDWRRRCVESGAEAQHAGGRTVRSRVTVDLQHEIDVTDNVVCSAEANYRTKVGRWRH